MPPAVPMNSAPKTPQVIAKPRGSGSWPFGYHHCDQSNPPTTPSANPTAASVLGAAVGFALGVVGGLLWSQWWYPNGQDPDPRGFAITWGVFGALFIGTAGGMMGLWTARPGAYAPAPSGPTDPYVIAVDAGDQAEEVRTLLARRGGHELHTGAVPHGTQYHPSPHPA